MDALYSVGNQVYNLLDGVCDAGILHGSGVISIAVHDADKFFRKAGSTQRNHPFNLLAVGYRHDARFDGNGDARLPHPIQKVVVVVVVKKQLRDQVGSTGSHLFLQVQQVFLQIRSLRVDLGIAGGSDVKTAVLLNIINQVAGIAVIGLRRYVWIEVAAQRQDIFDVIFPQIIQYPADMFFGGIDTA